VRGIGRLRAVDALITPTVPAAGNSNTPTIMIAKKAVEMSLTKSQAA